MSPSRHTGNAGFTLIEVLLVTILLAFLGYTTFQTVRSTINTKEDVDIKTETLQTARSALSLMERDFRLAFFVTAEDLGWAPRDAKTLNGQTPGIKPAPLTFFQGKETLAHFSARSHQRKSSDVPENEQHVVKFELKGNELVRLESSHFITSDDRNDESKMHKMTLLSGIKSLKFSYFDGDKGDWVSSWDTDKPENKERLPMSVKIEIEFTPDVESTVRRKIADMKIGTSVPIMEAAFKKGGPVAPVTPSPNN